MPSRVFGVLPGWALPSSLYEPLAGGGDIFDFGFFSASEAPMRLPGEAFGKGRGAVIVAHSMGCLFAIPLAAAAPSVEALILLNPFPRFSGSADFPGRAASEIRAMSGRLDSSPASLLKSFHRTCASPESFKPDVPSTLNRTALKEGLDALERLDVRAEAAAVKCPCLAICADADQIVRREMSGSLAGLVPGVEMRSISGAGHFMPFTRADECSRLISEFLHAIDA